MMEWNPFRSIYSTCDFVRTRLANMNLRFNLLTTDAWLFLIGVMSVLAVSNSSPEMPGYWFVVTACVVITPYMLCYPLGFFYRPIPFFRSHPATVPLQEFEGEVVCFGSMQWYRQARRLFQRSTYPKTSRIRYRWCKGTVVPIEGLLLVRVQTKCRVLTSDHDGLVMQALSMNIPYADVASGEATLLFGVYPALKAIVDGETVIVVLRKSLQLKLALDSEVGEN